MFEEMVMLTRIKKDVLKDEIEPLIDLKLLLKEP